MLYLYFRSVYLFHVIPSPYLFSGTFLVHNTIRYSLVLYPVYNFFWLSGINPLQGIHSMYSELWQQSIQEFLKILQNLFFIIGCSLVSYPVYL